MPSTIGATPLLPAALPSLIFILLVLREPDLGTALVCAAVTGMMLYLAGAEVKYFRLCRAGLGSRALSAALPRRLAAGAHAGLHPS